VLACRGLFLRLLR